MGKDFSNPMNEQNHELDAEYFYQHLIKGYDDDITKEIFRELVLGSRTVLFLWLQVEKL